MPKPAETSRTELETLHRVARARLVDQINDTNVDADAIVGRLEVFVETLIARHIGDLSQQLSRS